MGNGNDHEYSRGQSCRKNHIRQGAESKYGRLFFSAMTIILFILAGVCYGNDLDDGISAEDTPISHYDTVDRDFNITYIKMQAKSHARISSDEINGKDAVVSKNPTGSIDSVVTGAGSTFKGDVIIIDESKGDKTVIVE